MKQVYQIKQAVNPSTLELYIYTEVQGDGYDWRKDEVIQSETSAKHIREQLEACADVPFINIYINSLGGSVMEGVAIYNQLKRHKAFKTVYIDGFACSVASVIAMAGDRVVMPRNTLMMIHNAWMYAAGNAGELRKCADDLDRINEASRQAYLVKAGEGLAEQALISMMDQETFLTAMQCVEYGLADEYAEADADMAKAQEMLSGAQQKGLLKGAPPLLSPQPPAEQKACGLMQAFIKSLDGQKGCQ